MSARWRIVQWFAVAALAASCGGSTANRPIEPVRSAVTAKVTPPSPPSPPSPSKSREEPPPSAPPTKIVLPTPIWAELPSGLSLATVERHGLPIVEVRVVVRAGIAADGDRPGTAMMTAELLKEGGAGDMKGDALLGRFDALGSSLSVDVDSDRTVIGLRVLRDDLGAALELLGTLVSKPRMGASDFDKAKRRKSAEADDLAQEDGDWGAWMMLRRELFRLPTGRHPYATSDAQRGDIDRLAIADCRAFHKRFYVPANTFVVIAGDTTAAQTRALVEKAFGNYKAEGTADKASPAAPAPTPTARSITVVDRPGSIQSSIYAATLGPARSDPRYPALAVLNRVLGGKGTGRLFMDVREKRSLAYDIRSQIDDLAGGPSVIYAEAQTQTDRTGLTVQAFLEHFDRIVKEAPTVDEVSVASRFLAEDLGTRTGRLAGFADAIVQARVMGLPEGALNDYPRNLLEAKPSAVSAVAAEVLRGAPRVIVVAGDVAVIGPMLSHFGEVHVVDPKQGFALVRTIPQNPNAALEAAPSAPSNP